MGGKRKFFLSDVAAWIMGALIWGALVGGVIWGMAHQHSESKPTLQQRYERCEKRAHTPATEDACGGVAP